MSVILILTLEEYSKLLISLVVFIFVFKILFQMLPNISADQRRSLLPRLERVPRVQSPYRHPLVVGEDGEVDGARDPVLLELGRRPHVEDAVEVCPPPQRRVHRHVGDHAGAPLRGGGAAQLSQF